MHPFFQALNYPWHLPEAVAFYNQLDQAFTDKVEIEKIYRRCGAYLVEIPAIDPNKTSSELWIEVLQKLSQKLRIEKLCKTLVELNAVAPVLDLIKVVTDLKSAIDPEVIDIDRLVLDRKPLRGYLHLLANPNEAVKVLLIRGGEKSGKSYSSILFENLARQQGIIPVTLIKSVVVKLDDVLDALFTAAGDIKAKPIPDKDIDFEKEVSEEGDQTRDAYYIKVCNTLLATAKEHKEVVWISIDDLGFRETVDAQGEKKLTSIMDSKIRHFFNQFVNHMTTPPFRAYFRLMLINYPIGKLPTVWNKYYLKDETLNELDIKLEDIEEAIHNWYRNQNIRVSTADVKARATEILSKIDSTALLPDLPSRLERIRDEVVNLLTTNRPAI